MEVILIHFEDINQFFEILFAHFAKVWGLYYEKTQPYGSIYHDSYLFMSED